MFLPEMQLVSNAGGGRPLNAEFCNFFLCFRWDALSPCQCLSLTRHLPILSCLGIKMMLLIVASPRGQNLPLPPMPYEYSALEPHIDEATMRVHHLKHHQTYTDKLNGALAEMRGSDKFKHLAKLGVDALLQHLDDVPEGKLRNTVRTILRVRVYSSPPRLLLPSPTASPLLLSSHPSPPPPPRSGAQRGRRLRQPRPLLPHNVAKRRW